MLLKPWTCHFKGTNTQNLKTRIVTWRTWSLDAQNSSFHSPCVQDWNCSLLQNGAVFSNTWCWVDGNNIGICFLPRGLMSLHHLMKCFDTFIFMYTYYCIWCIWFVKWSDVFFCVHGNTSFDRCRLYIWIKHIHAIIRGSIQPSIWTTRVSPNRMQKKERSGTVCRRSWVWMKMEWKIQCPKNHARWVHSIYRRCNPSYTFKCCCFTTNILMCVVVPVPRTWIVGMKGVAFFLYLTKQRHKSWTFPEARYSTMV